MNGYVLDSSALLAFLWRQRDCERVEASPPNALVAMSAINCVR